MANLRIIVVATAISSVFAESRSGRCGAAYGPCGDVTDDDGSGGPCCSKFTWYLRFADKSAHLRFITKNTSRRTLAPHMTPLLRASTQVNMGGAAPQL